MTLKTKNIKAMIGTIILVLFVVFLGTILSLMILPNSGLSNKAQVMSADGFTIEGYKVYLDVQENNQVLVTEDITVDWYDISHHGIYKFIPKWLEYTSKNNKTIKRKANITDLRSSSDPYTVDVVNNKERIKLGSSNSYVTRGLKTYRISYTYDMGKDPFTGFDEFIFHAIGDYWGTTVPNVSLQIKMPKDFDSTKINFFLDKYRKRNINDLVDYSIKDNTIYASTKLSLPNSLTIDIELPDNYFQNCNSSYGIISLVTIIIILILTYYTFRRWQKYGKDYPKPVKTVEFYPPDNLNAAQIGYIYGTTSSTKLAIALIVELASKGYIQINELPSGNIEITNLYPKPREPKKPEVAEPRVIEIKKLKDYDKTISQDAITMMKYLFKDGDTKSLSTNIESFLKVRDELVQNNFIEIVNDSERLKEEKEKLLQAQYQREYQKYTKKLKTYEDNQKNLKPISEMEQIVYNKLFESEDVILLNEHETFYEAILEIGSLLYNDHRLDSTENRLSFKILSSCLICILEFVLLYFSYSIIKDLDPKFSFLYSLGLISCFITIFFTIIMERKTEYREFIEPQIDGFCEFLEKAEKDELEALVAKNPSYFYDILPYTYVLGISKKWISKFENIYMPKIDMGTFDYGSDAAYLDMASDFYYPASSSSGSSSSSGCSSCGGGCSSCGGGCSSCGGGGSW